MCPTVDWCVYMCVCVCVSCVCVVAVAEALLGNEHGGEGEINNDIYRTSWSPVWLAALIKIG